MAEDSKKANDCDQLDFILTENAMLRRKLQSKSEALLILSKELVHCRSKADEFRLLSEQLQEKATILKRKVNQQGGCGAILYEGADWSWDRLLENDLREQNKSLRIEAEDLKQKLEDSEGDLQVLRMQLATERSQTKLRSRSESSSQRILKQVLQQQSSSSTVAPTATSSSEEETLSEWQKMVSRLEKMNSKCKQLERDVEAVLDEKQELVMERDGYRCKVHRLNHELNALLSSGTSSVVGKDGSSSGGSTRPVVDVDSLLMENRYLQEQLKQSQDVHQMLQQTLSKYKSLLEKKSTKGILRGGSGSKGSGKGGPAPLGSVISLRQVRQILQANPEINCRSIALPASLQGSSSNSNQQLSSNAVSYADLQSLCLALLDALGDKSLAVNHQRKTNKILAARLVELESKLRVIDGGELVISPSQKILEGFSSLDLISNIGACSTTSSPLHSPTRRTSSITADHPNSPLSTPRRLSSQPATPSRRSTTSGGGGGDQPSPLSPNKHFKFNAATLTARERIERDEEVVLFNQAQDIAEECTSPSAASAVSDDLVSNASTDDRPRLPALTDNPQLPSSAAAVIDRDDTAAVNGRDVTAKQSLDRAAATDRTAAPGGSRDSHSSLSDASRKASAASSDLSGRCSSFSGAGSDGGSLNLPAELQKLVEEAMISLEKRDAVENDDED